MSGGFQFQASYTYSHALDEISNSSLNPFGLNSNGNVDVVTPLNPFNIRQLNYGNADYDIRQSFVMNYVWSDALRHLTDLGSECTDEGLDSLGYDFQTHRIPVLDLEQQRNSRRCRGACSEAQALPPRPRSSPTSWGCQTLTVVHRPRDW